jgi:aryl-alcohol dehydrogenase-like predicted oxidoreductase
MSLTSYRTLGRSGLIVSPLALGTMTFGTQRYAVDPGFTATDFNQHSGPGTVEDAAARLVKYATIDADGPTGKFLSDDNSPETGESLW